MLNKIKKLALISVLGLFSLSAFSAETFRVGDVTITISKEDTISFKSAKTNLSAKLKRLSSKLQGELKSLKTKLENDIPSLEKKLAEHRASLASVAQKAKQHCEKAGGFFGGLLREAAKTIPTVQKAANRLIANAERALNKKQAEIKATVVKLEAELKAL